MLALLLLPFAGGVNGILSAKVNLVRGLDGKIYCSNGCTVDRIFYSDKGQPCTIPQAVHWSTEKHRGLGCQGEDLGPAGTKTLRLRKPERDELSTCITTRLVGNNIPLDCNEEKMTGKEDEKEEKYKIRESADVIKELESTNEKDQSWVWDYTSRQ
ncbi:hypothetical protein CDD83_7164 [Cordyceps sp. RAO-2017]|nr:hypothetical protein CDD83_7164 [Cordyceps sp. RAO-2017]